MPLFQDILDAFAREIGAGPNKTVTLLLDNAGWHHGEHLRIPEGIRFCFLPSYTPELQPAERLWPLTDEGIANTPFDTLEALTEVLNKRCAAFSNELETIRVNTDFRWWPQKMNQTEFVSYAAQATTSTP